MWIRKRLDISTKDFLYAICSCVSAGSRNEITSKIEKLWKKENEQCFVSFSVRTGFDLLFRALNLESGSEILFSALTIPDMPRIVAHHGLVPVGVDLNLETLIPDASEIEAAITPKTKVIVIAHLFGGVSNLNGISDVAKKHNLLLIEDCAQAYYSNTFTGNSTADISMFSFGTIKTATALGGGILIFRDKSQLFIEIEKLHNSYPVQGRRQFLIKTLKYMALTFISSPRILPVFIRLLERKGIDYDTFIHGLSRSFPKGNFFEKIRIRPGFPLLKLMLRRFRKYDFTIIEKRIELGEFLVSNLPGSVLFPGSKSDKRTHWAFPVLAKDPQKLATTLRQSGFDATHKSSLQIVQSAENNPNSETQIAGNILDQVVFLPLYPEMPLTEFKRMVGYIRNPENKEHENQHEARD